MALTFEFRWLSVGTKLNPSHAICYPSIDENGDEPLFKSIQQIGVVQPILCREKDGEAFLLDGVKRFSAARRFKLEKLPALFVSGGDERELTCAVLKNQRASREMNAIERALWLERLKKKALAQDDEIVALLKVPLDPASQDRISCLLTLPEMIQERIARVGFSPREALLFKAFNDEELVAFEDVVRRCGLTRSQTRAFVDLASDVKRILENEGTERMADVFRSFAEGVPFDEILDRLDRIRSPKFNAFKARINEELAPLLRQGRLLSLVLPKDVASELFELRLKFKTVDELRSSLRGLKL